MVLSELKFIYTSTFQFLLFNHNPNYFLNNERKLTINFQMYHPKIIFSSKLINPSIHHMTHQV